MLQSELTNKGWSIISSNKKVDLDLFKNNFFAQLNKDNFIKKEFQNKKIKNIEDLRKKSKFFNNETINFIRKFYLDEFSFYLINFFSNMIFPVFGKDFLVQRFPQIQLNVPNLNSTKTPAHFEFMAGHSPYTYNLWAPLHDIEDDTGLYLINDKLSVKLGDEELIKNKSSRELLIKKHRIFPQIKLGEALIFNSFSYHGSINNKRNLSRISLDLRFQSLNKPLFQRYADYFKVIKF